MKKICAFFSILICLLLGVVSCKPSLPGDVLSKGKMADILYDYHVALSMAHSADGGDTGQSITYREAVLRKHDVTSAEFDSSMVYYMRHTELLEDVYKELGDRLNNEIVALGGNADASQFDNLSATGDTANVWNLAPAMVLSATKPFNAVSFDIPVDTAFHKGDCLMLDFDTQFIFQDGMRGGVALLAVQFKNDSIAQQVTQISNSQHCSIQVADNDNLGIKSVKGYFMLSDGSFASDMPSSSTLKLMFVEHIKLVRMHQPKAVQTPASSAGTSSTDSLKKDSAQRMGAASSAPSSSSATPSSSSQTQMMHSEPLPGKPGTLPPGRPTRMLPPKQLKGEPLKATNLR